MEATLPSHHGEGWKDVVDLGVDDLTLHLQPMQGLLVVDESKVSRLADETS